MLDLCWRDTNQEVRERGVFFLFRCCQKWGKKNFFPLTQTNEKNTTLFLSLNVNLSWLSRRVYSAQSASIATVNLNLITWRSWVKKESRGGRIGVHATSYIIDAPFFLPFHFLGRDNTQTKKVAPMAYCFSKNNRSIRRYHNLDIRPFVWLIKKLSIWYVWQSSVICHDVTAIPVMTM